MSANIWDCGWTQFPNALVDEWMSKLTPYELQIIMIVLRKTKGWDKKADKISISQMVKISGVSRSSVIRSCKSLEGKGLIAVSREDDDKNDKTYSLGVFSQTPPSVPQNIGGCPTEHRGVFSQTPTKETLLNTSLKETKTPIPPEGDLSLDLEIVQGEDAAKEPEPIPNRYVKSFPDAFERFIRDYPKSGKKVAGVAWDKAAVKWRKSNNVSEVIGKIEGHLFLCTASKLSPEEISKFPGPAVYLNEERWEDADPFPAFTNYRQELARQAERQARLASNGYSNGNGTYADMETPVRTVHVDAAEVYRKQVEKEKALRAAMNGVTAQ